MPGFECIGVLRWRSQLKIGSKGGSYFHWGTPNFDNGSMFSSIRKKYLNAYGDSHIADGARWSVLRGGFLRYHRNMKSSDDRFVRCAIFTSITSAFGTELHYPNLSHLLDTFEILIRVIRPTPSVLRAQPGDFDISAHAANPCLCLNARTVVLIWES